MQSRRYQVVLLFIMLLALWLSFTLRPTVDASKRLPAETFTNEIPEQFGGWVRVPSKSIAIDLYQKMEGERTTDNPYDDTFIQSYRNEQGHVLELAIAYGALQRQEVKIHRPDLCYYAQGYEVNALLPEAFTFSSVSQTIDGQRMQVRSRGQTQLVSYWIRVGDLFSQSAWQTRLYLIQQGLLGHVPDGVLVRVSSVVEDNAADIELIAAEQQAFMNALLRVVANTPIERLLLGEKLLDSKTI